MTPKKFIISGVLLAAMPILVLAAEFKHEDHYLLRSQETIRENLYAAGGTLTIEGNVEGDLVAAGGTINVSGNITEDATLAGGSLSLTGEVGGDVRAAGGEITIAGQVGGDVVAAGGKIVIMEGAEIQGDLVTAGGEISNNGTVHGKVLNYNDKERRDHRGAFLGFLGIWWLVKTAMGIVLGLLLLYFFRDWTTSRVHAATESPWKEMVRGFVFLVVVPVAIVISFITVVGIPVSLVVLALYGAGLLLAAVVGAIFLGAYVRRWIRKGELQVSWKTVVLGVILLQILKIIPIVGWIACLLVFLLGFGAVADWGYRKVRAAR